MIPRRCRLGVVVCGGALAAACGEPAVEIHVRDALELGAVETSATIRGRDGGYSGRLFGHSVWLYGDTILAHPDEAGETWHNSSMSFTEDQVAADGVGGFAEVEDAVGAPRPLLLLTEEERSFNEAHAATDRAKWILWPSALVSDPERSRGLVFYLKVLSYPGAFRFKAHGASLAVLTDLSLSPERPLLGQGTASTLLFGEGEPMLGAGAVVVDDVLYAYDCSGSGKQCIVGRVKLADALTRSAWRFWSGADWVSAWRQATHVMRAHDIVTVHWNSTLERFLAFYSQPISNDVMVRSAPAPEGPWSDARRAFRAVPPREGDVSYSAIAHAEYTDEETEYVTYHRGTAPFESEIRLVQVMLSRDLGGE
ncbi:MAG: DUF4185 domain-containing protein [Kofleriaceae bacterium]